ncbi:DUF4402 domain-containing protein [Vibrio sp. 2092]|uniref:DUF4402 domain-containing protein n=1 Tax=Vibrio sp. 2092 TaxID=3074593 RepID=UPI001A2154EE|nr:DUF4402 domain-containing protein [Vibrio sp. 2092]MCA2471535.1 DUF4402 domain-containing protein [Vibrio alginolyticus]MDW2151554.1 DUF4402 domain-containing protein [Vibrio sp. 2092]HAT8518463.1 DUF4402 domain-containing protein [Vibrio vulnificus]
MKNFKKIALSVALTSMFAGFAATAHANADESFDATLSLLAPIDLTEVKGLDFEPTLANQNVNVVTAPTSVDAAVFTARGTANWEVKGQVVESSIVMTTGDGSDDAKKITVDTFTYGGSMDASGNAQFSSSGDLSNLRVGGTAHVQANDIAGEYRGTATFRLTYL